MFVNASETLQEEQVAESCSTYAAHNLKIVGDASHACPLFARKFPAEALKELVTAYKSCALGHYDADGSFCSDFAAPDSVSRRTDLEQTARVLSWTVCRSSSGCRPTYWSAVLAQRPQPW